MSAPSLPSLLISPWHASWSVVVAAAACAALYLCATCRLRSRWPLGRTASFLAGIACVAIALQSGIDTFDDQLLSVHMVQHMLLLMLAPLLLLGGRPVILALRALPARQRPALARLLHRIAPLTGPVQCVSAFSLVLVLTHLPAFYDATLRHPALHEAEHALYLVAGLLLWWPLVDGDPVPARRLGGLGRLVYMLAAMPAMALVGAYLNRHPSLVYPAYGPPGRALRISALVDQQQAGAIMWVAGSVIMVAVGLWSAVAALVAEERRQQAREARAPKREASELPESRAGTIEGSLP
jgi:putative membrane protein